MTTNDVIRDAADIAQRITAVYLSDFTDDHLLVRPMPQINHAARQLGHLINSERSMMTRIGIAMPDLPPGFTAVTRKLDKPVII